MVNQHITCPVCLGPVKKNGTTSAGKTRWRCKDRSCGHSFTNTNDDPIQTARFRMFYEWFLSSSTLSSIAAEHGYSRRQLTRWFENFWLVHVPDNTDSNRIYDQLFVDGTYFGHQNCLLVASTKAHVVAWHWCRQEDTFNYNRLFDKVGHAPLVVTTDGHQGSLEAIKTTWSQAHIQRCLVHVKRNIQRYVGLYPVLPSGKALRGLSLSLLRVSNLDEAAEWTAKLQQFHDVYGKWLSEKTYIKDLKPEEIPKKFRRNKKFFYMHSRHRSAYELLAKLERNKHLFTFLTSQEDAVEGQLARDTNSLEGGINAGVKALARYHRGMPEEHQRTAVDWWLHLHTQYPGDPIEIARSQKWGRSALAKVQAASTNNTANDLDGAPARYDTGIESTHTNDIGIRKGSMR
ncbi:MULTISPECIES: IS1249 family transposase [Corynebacterium]|uniref:IS1249 family transposase n=1 Tax=Corynebacterium TaxID=1716 RepID=UPI001EF64BDE|nr:MULTISPECIES: IS1249 family transposase [Corynebacterium]MCG7243505.1 IS1249 family transposase [Corynebacterium sp. ACRPS]MDK8474569.1 IS1249 family transposase [Corynebacterium sp. MSK078]MDK8659551.1 IS1249 family transposase [Corynebacterium sp. MSK204]MDK8815362.1 IS1249 family transposase [Corynebacterium sp. MSK073]WKS59911.1 IS1249 family transposase [Corynebacterium accolens]